VGGWLTPPTMVVGAEALIVLCVVAGEADGDALSFLPNLNLSKKAKVDVRPCLGGEVGRISEDVCDRNFSLETGALLTDRLCMDGGGDRAEAEAVGAGVAVV